MSGRFASSPAAGVFARMAFGQFRVRLYRYLLRRLRSAESAEDLTQEVYLRLLRTADRQVIRNPQAYVFGVAFNVLCEFRLNEEHNPVAVDSDAAQRLGESLADEAPAPEDLYERQFRSDRFDRLLRQLSPMQQAVLLMAKRQGLAHAQIAARLNISVATVRKHLMRAVAQCRKLLQEPEREA